MAIREPAVAGTFYPSDCAQLKKFCANHLSVKTTLRTAKAIILPHAGYLYSGLTACKVLRQVIVPDALFLLGPNHRVIGASFALSTEGAWETPLGEVPIATEIAKALI